MRFKFIFNVSVLLFAVLVLLTGVSVRADFPKSVNISSDDIPEAPFPLSGVIPISVNTSMSGTIKLTSPSGAIQSITVPSVLGGFSTQVSLSETGIYSVQESYKLKTSSPLLGINANFSETRTSNYNNLTTDTKIINVNSTVGNFSASLPPGNVTAQSFNPSSVEPGQSFTVDLKVKDEGIPAGGVIADSASVSAVWNVNIEITGGSANNNLPVVSISTALQSQPNGDVQIAYYVQDTDNDQCNVELQYSEDGAIWTFGTLAGEVIDVDPGSRTLYWKSSQDEPDAQGSYQVRMRADDGTASGSWSAPTTLTLDNTPGPNDPPSALNLNIKTIDALTNQEADPPRNPVTGDKLKAGYTFSDPNGDVEKGSTLVWYKNGAQFLTVTVQNEQSKILPQPVTRGERWFFTITPSDGRDEGGTRTSNTTIVGNAPPKAQNVRIQPTVPASSDNLKADYTYSDPENDPQGAPEIKWYKDGIQQPQYNNKDVLPAAATARGDIWKFSIRPRDAVGDYGALVYSSEIRIVNQKPIVEIMSVYGNSGKITITYNLIDQDGDRCDLLVSYRTGTSAFGTKATTEGSTTSVTPGNGLTLIWRSDIDQPAGFGNYRIGMKPNDGMDSGSEDMSDPFPLDNNDAPSVLNVAISPSSPFSSDILKGNYEYKDLNGDEESGTEIRWYRDQVEQSAFRNQKEVPASATKRDESWYFTVKPKDGKEFGEEKKSQTVKIKNSPPVATDVKLEPLKATADDNLKASYKYGDADNDPEVNTQIKWYIDGVLMGKYDNQRSIPAEDTVKNQTWYFTVLVSDGTDNGALVESNRVKLGNVAPVVTGLTIPSDGFRDIPMEFELADSDGDTCSLVVEYRGGMASSWTPATIKEPLTGLLPGKITLTWESYKDQEIRGSTKFQIRVTPNDGTVKGTAVESSFFTIDNNIPPVASNLSIKPLNPTTADSLEAFYDYSDADGGKESGSEIKWYKNNGTITEYKGKILSASATAKGDSWYFIVKPRDGAKFGSPVTSDPVTIINSPPVAVNPIIIPANPMAGSTLVARYDYRDIDGDKESGTEIEWYKNDLPQLTKVVSSEEDKKLPVSVVKGEKWYYKIKPKDGSDFGIQITSASVTVGNAVPVVESIAVSGESGDVVITFTLIDGDGDACDLKVEYQGGSVKSAWTKATIKEPTSGVLPGKDLKLTWQSKVDEPGRRASDYKIRITPSDAVSTGASVVSKTFSINNNSLPVAANLALLPLSPTTSSNLETNYTFIDPDGDKEEKPEIKWYKNGLVEILYDNLKVLPSSATTKDDRWYYTIKVNDGKEYGKVQLSPSVTIINEYPNVSNVKLSPDYPRDEDDLIANYTYKDADGDTEDGTQIRWYKDGIAQSSYDDLKTISGLVTQPGEEWYFTVTPKDGFDFGLPQSSNKVFIANKPPSVNSLSITPVNPLTTDDLTASYIYIDPENDPEQGSRITWYKNSVTQSKYESMLVVPSDATAKKQVWYFTVMPKDGKQFGVLKQSGFVVVGNTPPKAQNPYITPSYPLKKDDLQANYEYIDIDNDPEGRSEIKWYRNGAWVSTFDGLKKIPSKNINNGEIWYFTIRPKDDADFGEVVTSPSVEIGSPIPRVNNLVIKPANPFTNDDLSVDYAYVDPNNIPESGSKITWYKNGVAQTEYDNLRILPASATYKDEQWYFTVRPSNGRLFGEEQSSIPVTIANSPPKLTEVLIRPEIPTTDDNIIVSYVFTDPDGDVETRNEIKWFRDATLQSTYNNMTEIPANATTRNEKWYFTVRSSDGIAFSELATSSVVTIRNGKPRVANPVISPANPKTADDLSLIYSYIDTEDDPEFGTEIRWFKNSVEQTTYYSVRAIPSSATSRGDEWYCEISPRDGIDFGVKVTSPIIKIDNTRPEAIDIMAESDQVFRGKTVKIISTGQDMDPEDSGSTLECQIQYRIGGSVWESLTTIYTDDPSPRWEAVFSPDAKARLGEYDFRARFEDVTGAQSDWLQQNGLVAVNNSPPVIAAGADNFRVLEDSVKEFDLTPYGSDLESGIDLIWSLDDNSVDNTLFRASILRDSFLEIKPLDNKNGKDDITLILIDTDGTKTEKRDVTIIIDPANDPPSAPALITISPESPKTLDTLVCTASGSVDIDGDKVVYRYQWYNNGIIQPDLKSSDVPYSRTAKDEVWRCEVTPSDGMVDGPSRFAEVTIGNTRPVVTNVKISGNSKDIRITYDLEDADSDKCDLKLEYKIKNVTWKTATIKGTVSRISPAKGLTLTWQSGVDEDGALTEDCRMRIVSNDGILSSEPKESEPFMLDNKPPVFTVTAVANPIYQTYIDVSVVSDEKLLDPQPEVSAILGDGQIVELEMKSIGNSIWTGKFELEPGFDGVVSIKVKGADVLGNVSELELKKGFSIPAPTPRPSVFALGQNYPNPVIEDTRIPYQLAQSSIVVIKIYNSAGQVVRTIDEGYKVAGYYDSSDKSAYWDGRDDNGNLVATGVYFYHLKAGSFEKVKKMGLLR